MAETLATYSVPEHHVNMYTANVKAALNKKGGLITPYVDKQMYKGEKVQVVNFLGPITFIQRNTPYSDTKLVEMEHTQRWMVGYEYDAAVLVDRLDLLQMIYDPTSPYVDRFREGAARRQDQIIMDSFFGTAKTGLSGATNTIFPVADTVLSGATGLTVLKLRALRKLIKKRHVDLRAVKPIIAVTSEQTDNLLGETTINSFDYNSVKALVDGEVQSFMGFTFVPYEAYLGTGIPSYGAAPTTRQCPVWVPDGMQFGSWEDLVITISNRADKNNIKQIHGTFTAGATRLEEGRVFMVEANEP